MARKKSVSGGKTRPARQLDSAVNTAPRSPSRPRKAKKAKKEKKDKKDKKDRRQREEPGQLGGDSQAMSAFGQSSAFGAPSGAASTPQLTGHSSSPFDPSRAASPFGRPSTQPSGFGAPSGLTQNTGQISRSVSPFGAPSNPLNPFLSQTGVPDKTNSSSSFGAPSSSNITLGFLKPPAETPSNPFTAKTDGKEVTQGSNPFTQKRDGLMFGASNPATAATQSSLFAPNSAAGGTAMGTSSFTKTNGLPNPFLQGIGKSAAGFGIQDATADGQPPFAQPADQGNKRRKEFAGQPQNKRQSSGPAISADPQASFSTATAQSKDANRKRKNGADDRPGKKQNSAAKQRPAINGTAVASNPYAQTIYDQLRKDGVKPPKWPSDPGNPSNRKVMEDFKDAYKQYQSRVRVSLIKGGLIDDPDVRKKLEDAIDFKGICEEMCPEYEKISRIVEYDVKQPEKEKAADGVSMWAAPNRMVKAFKRSAAGMDAPLPMEVLSPAALRRTVDYLIDDLLQGDEHLPSLHNFLWDRTRAVRKDFIFQNAMSPEERRDQIYCLETIARFHATALHLLSQEGFAAEDFSEQQEREQLGKTLLSLIQAYDETTSDGLGNENEAEFRAYYLLFNAHDPFVKQQLQEWGSDLWFDSEEVQTAVSLMEAMQNPWRGRGPLKPQVPLSAVGSSFTTYFSIVENPRVSYTMACFAEIHFTEIRQHMLRLINRAFGRIRDNPKDLTADAVNDILRFDTTEECIEFVEQHDMEFSSDGADEPYLIVQPKKQVPSPTVRQSFSEKMVERKRGDRSLPEVIHTTVFEEESSQTDHHNDETNDSMFLPQPGDGPKADSTGSVHKAFDKSQLPPFKTPASTFPDSQRQSTNNSPSLTNGSGVSDKVPQFAKGTPIIDPPKEGPSVFPQASATFGSIKGKEPNVGQPSSSPRSPGPPSIDTAIDQAAPASAPKFSWSSPTSNTPNGSETLPLGTAGASGALSFLKDQATLPSKTHFLSGNAEHSTPGQQGKFSSPSIAPLAAGKATSGTSTTPVGSGEPSTTSLKPAPSQESPASSLFTPSSEATVPRTAALPAPSGGHLQSSLATPPGTSQTSPLSSTPTLSQTPKAAVQKKKPRDLLGDFTKWFVLGDEGLMEQFQDNFVEHLLGMTYKAFQKEEEERKRQEEDELSWAEALKFRRYNLGLKFFYRWRDTARKLALKRIGRQGKVAVKAWRAAKAAEAKAAKDKAAHDEAARLKRLNESSFVEELHDRAAKRARRSVSGRRSSADSLEQALLDTGIFSGLKNEREAVSECVRDENISDHTFRFTTGSHPRGTFATPIKPKDPLRSTGAGVSKSVPKVYETRKKRMLRDIIEGKQPITEDASSLLGLSHNNGTSFRRSLPPGTKVTNFTKYQRSTPGSSVDADTKAKRQSGVRSDYWRLKARGLVTMPNGLALHESLAVPMIYDGVRYPEIGDYGLGPGSRATQTPDSDDDTRRQRTLGDGLYGSSTRLSDSHGISAVNPASSPQQHTAKQPATNGSLQATEVGNLTKKPDGATASGGDYEWKKGLEETLKEIRELGAELEEGTDWFREQNQNMSKASTPWDV